MSKVNYKELSPDELFDKSSSFNTNPFHNQLSSNPSLAEQYALNIHNDAEKQTGVNYGAVQLFNQNGNPRSQIYATRSEPEHQKTNSYAGNNYHHSERTGMLDLLNAEIPLRRKLPPSDPLYLRYSPRNPHAVGNIRRPSSPIPSSQKLPDISRGEALQKLSAMSTKAGKYNPGTYADIIQQRFNKEKTRMGMLSERDACDGKTTGGCQQWLNAIAPDNSEYGYTYIPDKSNYSTSAQAYGHRSKEYSQGQLSNLRKARENLFEAYEKSKNPSSLIQQKIKNDPNLVRRHNQQDYSLLGSQIYNALVGHNNPLIQQISQMQSQRQPSLQQQMVGLSTGNVQQQQNPLVNQQQPRGIKQGVIYQQLLQQLRKRDQKAYQKGLLPSNTINTHVRSTRLARGGSPLPYFDSADPTPLGLGSLYDYIHHRYAGGGGVGLGSFSVI
jgi:hypothetical protein